MTSINEKRLFILEEQGIGRGFLVDDSFIQDVCKRLGCNSPLEWSTFEPDWLCAGIICVFMSRYEVKKH